MATGDTREGPLDWRDMKPITVVIGKSVDVLVPSRDGVEGSTAATFYGATNDISAATLNGKLTINTPDGSSDYTVNFTDDAEVTKTDAYTSGYTDSWLIQIPSSVTTTWAEGEHDGEFDEIDSSGSPTKTRAIALLRFKVITAPSAE